MEVGSDTEKQRLFGNAKDTTQEAKKHNRIQSRSANPFRRGRRVLQGQPEFACERLETDFGPKKRPESERSAG